MATTTPNLGLTKPTVGADADAWGGQLNASLDTLDAKVLDKTTGGSISGAVNVIAATTAPAVRITQTGTGEALRVEDETNPDATPFVIDAAGNVGVGTGSPVTRLSVTDSATNSFVAAFRGAGGSNIVALGTTSGGASIAGFTAGFAAATDLIINPNAGNLGLGVTPSAWGSGIKAAQLGAVTSLYNSGNNGVFGVNTYNDGTNSRYLQSAAAGYFGYISGEWQWGIAPSGTAGATINFRQDMTLTQSGNLLVGTTNNSGNRRFVVSQPQATFSTEIINTAASGFGVVVSYAGGAPNNTSNEFLACGDTGATRFLVRSNGGIANFQANNVNLSDRREKTNFAPAKSYLDVICAIPVQTFNYVDQNLEDDPGLTLGVVAQDVQAVAPELVMESNWGTKEEPKMRLSIHQTDLQYALMKCIQEQQAMIAALESRLAALEAK